MNFKRNKDKTRLECIACKINTVETFPIKGAIVIQESGPFRSCVVSALSGGSIRSALCHFGLV